MTSRMRLCNMSITKINVTHKLLDIYIYIYIDLTNYDYSMLIKMKSSNKASTCLACAINTSTPKKGHQTQ